MSKTNQILEFWQNFISSKKIESESLKYETWHFCNDEINADSLAQLVIEGTKTATAGLLWAYEAEGEAIPKTGDFSVITRWDGTPECVIQAVEVTVTPFNEVSPAFAYEEGEGDRSLEYWRSVHWDYFSKDCAEIGKIPDKTMPVVCERFRVVYKQD